VPQFKATAKLGAFLAQLPNWLVISALICDASGDHHAFLCARRKRADQTAVSVM
jgi:hypothetical protein